MVTVVVGDKERVRLTLHQPLAPGQIHLQDQCLTILTQAAHELATDVQGRTAVRVSLDDAGQSKSKLADLIVSNGHVGQNERREITKLGDGGKKGKPFTSDATPPFEGACG